MQCPQQNTAMATVFGQGVVGGYVIGRAAVMGAAVLEVAHYHITAEAVEAECTRLDAAIAAAQADLLQLKEQLPEDAPLEVAPLLDVHHLLLADPLLRDQSHTLIQEHLYNAEWALTTQGQRLIAQFEQMDDAYLRERSADVRQVIERVLLLLAGKNSQTESLSLTSDSTDMGLIVVARDISPADMLRLRKGHFTAFLTDLGGPTSHTAIVARSMDIPAVVGLEGLRRLVRDGDLLVVDGFTGAVIINPSELVLQQYRQLQAKHLQQCEQLSRLRDTPAVTLDGISISLEANIELPQEAHDAFEAGADGIGLFRSEFLFMGRRELPSEEEQYEAYSTVVKAMQGRPVTIRTLDIGADKTLDGEQTVATNPALGLRAIRYCLANPELFQTQLRALLRASEHGLVRILIPMISTMEEVHAVRMALARAKNELTAQGQTQSYQVELGAMVEVPAVAIAIEPFAQSLDFLSIGTNDLIQYVMAVDRTDAEVADLYDPTHPAVLRLIAHTINRAQSYGKPVSVCGEMAGDVRLTRMLLGLGLRKFSMPAAQIPRIKQEILGSHSAALSVKVASALNRADRIDLLTLH